jgi:carbamoyl-phosphate synthase small subunit
VAPVAAERAGGPAPDPAAGTDSPAIGADAQPEPEAVPDGEPEELYWGEDVPVDEPGVPSAPPAEPATSRAVAAAPLVGTARPPAVLVLEDGRVFRGSAYGATGETFGEAVFNTGMTGYQETLTDPSYHRQVVVMTAPHIGNTGANDDDPESSRIWVAGYVVRDPSRVASSWRSQRSLDDELATAGVVGISGVDTRALTRHLRERGAMRVGVSSEVDGTEGDVAALLERVRASPGMAGADLAGEVTTTKPYVVPATTERRFRVAALDLGIKRSTPRYLAAAGCDVVVLPAHATAEELLALRPDGVFVSNGPGDPATADGPVAALRGVLDAGTPVFGICFGNQVLGRALGLGTYKLVYGHRGVNQPVQDRATGRVAITSHNHGFAVDADPTGPVDTPYGRVEVSHIDLNDGVVEGLRCLDVPAFSVQYHPEAAPGPHDANGLFASFAELMESRRTPEVAADGPPDAPRTPSHHPEA